jgi:integrase/recombinase XerD
MTAVTAVTAARWLEPALPLDETFDDILSAWRRYAMASGHSERTITSRAYTLRRLARTIDPMTADRDDLTDWLADLMDRRTGAPVTRSSRATYRAQVRAFYAFLVSCGRRGDDPSAGLPQPRVPRAYPRPLTPAEVVRVLAACEDPRAAQTRAYVVLACYAGLRVHEIAKIRGEDIMGEVLRVVGKGGSDATVPLHPRIVELARTMPDRGWWFPAGHPAGSPIKGTHVGRIAVCQAITRALRRADVSGTPHACRHFYGTQVLIASGGNLRIAQRALRHADIRSTAIYTQVSDVDLYRAVSGI